MTDLKAHKVIAHVLLHKPIPTDDGETMTAYFRLYLVSAASLDAAVEAVALDVAELGVLDPAELRVGPTDVASLDPVVRRSYPEIGARSIWYRSGRGFHE